VESGLKSLHTVKQKTNVNRTQDDTSYANPDIIYNYTSYFPDETYEFAINFVFDTGTVSQAYPIMGYDYHGSYGTFDKSLLGQDIGWEAHGQNSHGVVRINEHNLYSNVDFEQSSIDVLTPVMNTHELHTNVELMTKLKDKGVIGYFVSRRPRIPDLVMSGLITNAATASLSSFTSLALSVLVSKADTLGYGETNNKALSSFAYFPTPLNAMPFSTEALLAKGVDGGTGIDPKAANTFLDAVLFAKIPAGSNRKYAFYSPDITSDTARIASMDFNDDYGVTTSVILDAIQSKSGWMYKQNPSNTVFNSAASYLPYMAIATSIVHKALPTKSISGVTFVDDRYRTYTDGGFTGLLDRQIAYPTYVALRSASVYGDYPSDHTNALYLFLKDQQEIFLNSLATNLSTDSSNLCVSGANYDWASDYDIAGSAGYREESLEYVQLLMPGVAYSPYLGIEVSDSWGLYSNLNPEDEKFSI
jgi:hypothetical protein